MSELLLSESPIEPVGCVYEHPFGERIKLLLRLEIIFKQAIYHQHCRDQYETQKCLDALFALLNLAKRYELRSVFLKELERINTILLQLQNSKQVETKETQKTCQEIADCKQLLHHLDSKHIDSMRNIDFLKAIKLRNIHETGIYLFEVPELQHWLLQPPYLREQQVKIWLADFVPIQTGTYYLLQLIRGTSRPETLVAESGIYIKAVGNRHNVDQLLRISIDEKHSVYPSVSGDGYRYAIRFMERNHIDKKPYQTNKLINFELSACGI